MSYNKCKNCIYKNGIVKFNTKCNNDTEDYKPCEVTIDQFIDGLSDGWLQIGSPRTKLEKVIAQVNKLWYYPEYDFDMEGGKVTKYVIYYKSGQEIEKTPEQYNEWRKSWLNTYKHLIIERL